MSWDDEINAAAPGVARALVYLERAQGRGGKNAAANDIASAIGEADVHRISDLHELLDRYGLSYSIDGLAEAAERFAAELEAEADFSLPIGRPEAEVRGQLIEDALEALAAAKRKSARGRAWSCAEEAAALAKEVGVANAKRMLGCGRWPEFDALQRALEELAAE
jgi:hypothetical protein